MQVVNHSSFYIQDSQKNQILYGAVLNENKNRKSYFNYLPFDIVDHIFKNYMYAPIKFPSDLHPQLSGKNLTSNPAHIDHRVRRAILTDLYRDLLVLYDFLVFSPLPGSDATLSLWYDYTLKEEENSKKSPQEGQTLLSKIKDKFKKPKPMSNIRRDNRGTLLRSEYTKLYGEFFAYRKNLILQFRKLHELKPLTQGEISFIKTFDQYLQPKEYIFLKQVEADLIILAKIALSIANLGSLIEKSEGVI